MPWYSPLFRVAGGAILDAARREYGQTATGRLFGQVQREVRTASRAPDRLGNALSQYSRSGVRDALTQLRGTQFGQFAREIHRYANTGDREMKRLLDRFLVELGPAGRLIKAVTGSQGGGGEVDQLVRILQAFGYEVLPPWHARREGEAGTERATAAAREYLESRGHQVSGPGEHDLTKPRKLPFGIPAHGEDGTPRQQATMPMADGPAQRFGVDHPIVTGEMVTASSSNVHSYGYDIESKTLYVRYLGYVRGARGRDGQALRAGPGSMYAYYDVTPEEFLTLVAANSKGGWVWDHLRHRGTWSGHKKDYRLVGVMGNYVPRKAGVRIDPKTGRLQEWFEARRVATVGGGWLTSALPSGEAGPMPWGEVDRGLPDTGAPDRALPDRG